MADMVQDGVSHVVFASCRDNCAFIAAIAANALLKLVIFNLFVACVAYK